MRTSSIQKSLYLIRHGESQSQSGHTDDHVNPPLSALGREQATRLSNRFEETPLDVLYVSTLTRAVETAELAKLPAGRLVMDSRVVEVAWNEEFYQRLELTEPHPDAEPDHHDAHMQETYHRAGLFLDEVLASGDKTVAVIGHQGIFRVLLEVFLTLPRTEEHIPMLTDNTGISLFQVNSRGQHLVRYWNDHHHITDLLGDRDPQI